MTRKQFKKLRQQRGLTQQEVAQRLKCTRSHYANLENGYRIITPRTAERIAKALR